MAKDKIFHTYNISGDPANPRHVTIREMGIMEMKLLSENIDSDFNMALKGLRRSVVKIDNEPVTHANLAGEKIEDYFSFREYSTLVALWADLHGAAEETLDTAKKSVMTSSGGTP